MDLNYVSDVNRETELQSLTSEQRKYLSDTFNFHGNFSVGVNRELGCIVFETSASTYASMEYYLGLEYEREDRTMYVNVDNDVLVAYDFDNERVQELLYTLGILEEETEEEEV